MSSKQDEKKALPPAQAVSILPSSPVPSPPALVRQNAMVMNESEDDEDEKKFKPRPAKRRRGENGSIEPETDDIDALACFGHASDSDDGFDDVDDDSRFTIDGMLKQARQDCSACGCKECLLVLDPAISVDVPELRCEHAERLLVLGEDAHECSEEDDESDDWST